MITRKEFIQYIEIVNKNNSNIDELEKVLGVSIFEASIFETFEAMNELFLHQNFTDEGVDIIYWYLYEQPCEWEEGNGTEIIDTPDKLWDKVKYFIK